MTHRFPDITTWYADDVMSFYEHIMPTLIDGGQLKLAGDVLDYLIEIVDEFFDNMTAFEHFQILIIHQKY